MSHLRVAILVLGAAPACTLLDSDRSQQDTSQCILDEFAHTRLTAPVPRLTAEFGDSVALDGNVLVVGAPHDEDPENLHDGMGDVFERVGDDWLAVAQRVSGAELALDYARAVAVRGDLALFSDENRVDLVQRFPTGEPGGWAAVGQVEALPELGAARVALADDRLVIGVTEAEDTDIRLGYAFVYERHGAMLGPPVAIDIGAPAVCEPPPAPCAHLGEAVAAQGDLVVIGAPGFNKAFVYRVGARGPLLEATLESPAPAPERFGATLAIDGDRIFVGDPESDGGRGLVMVFSNVGGQWVREAELRGPATTPGFGTALTAANRQVAMGVPFAATGDGAVWLFERDDHDEWQLRTILRDDSTKKTEFGTSVAMTPETLASGAPAEGAIFRAGAVYVFDLREPAQCTR